MSNATENPVERPVAPSVTREEIARRAGQAGFVLVDVLAPESYATAHLPGARSLPLAELPARARSVLPDLASDIVVYCGGPT